MHSIWYSNLIRALCETCGIANWEMVSLIKQIEVNGHTVALFPETDADDTLGMYVELLRQEQGGNSCIAQRLLESNTVGNGMQGFFCAIPGHGTIAYRTSICNAERLSGPQLLQAMIDLVSHATSRLHTALSAQPGQTSRVHGPVTKSRSRNIWP